MRALLAFLFAWGVGNIANNDWLEQLVERGWTSYPIPSALDFTPNWLWLVVLVTAATVYALWCRQPSPTQPRACGARNRIDRWVASRFGRRRPDVRTQRQVRRNHVSLLG